MSNVRRRLFRSIDGCCICRVKASKSRFAASTKYERYFDQCFKLTTNRTGELCFSCQKIRSWVKQPEKGKRDYSNVVDSQFPISERRRSSSTSTKRSSPPTAHDISRGPKTMTKASSVDIVDEDVLSEDDDEDFDSLGEPEVVFDTPVGSPNRVDIQKEVPSEGYTSIATQTTLSCATGSHCETATLAPFIDLSSWRQEEICCGTIFRGPDGEVLVDPKWLRPVCGFCNRSAQPPTPLEENTSASTASVFNEAMFGVCA